MELKFLFKYFLSLVLVANSSFSLALSEDCIKNIDLINDQDSAKMFHDNIQHCHGASESENLQHKNSIHDSEECLECEYCSMNNQVSQLNQNSELNFSLLNLQKESNVNKDFHSFIQKPKGPPPKIFS